MNSGHKAQAQRESNSGAARAVNACVVIPAYEAQQTIGRLVSDVAAIGLPVIVVDDASRDATAQAAASAGASVLRKQANGGKGMAVREALAVALERRHDWVITMDADGQHLASDIPGFLQAAAAGDCDVILGNRMEDPRGMPLVRLITNRTMSWMLSRIVGQWIPDTQCGFRMVSRAALEKIDLSSDRFEIESELIVKASRAGLRIRSIPVASVYNNEPSFVRPLQDTVRFFRFLRASRK